MNLVLSLFLFLLLLFQKENKIIIEFFNGISRKKNLPILGSITYN